MPAGDLRGPLAVRAGRSALDQLKRDGGLDPEKIRVIAGASGGPKWLILNRIDRVLIENWIVGRKKGLDLIGSSIGTWRFACFGQNDPLSAYDRFESGYLDFRVEDGADRAAITQITFDALEQVVDDAGAAELVANDRVRLNIMAVRSRALTASERAAPLAAGLLTTAAGNILSRRSLGLFFERALFQHPASPGDFARWQDFPLCTVPLAANNLKPALIASSSIPFVMEGIADIPGAPRGVYRDGGIIDYHWDVPFLPDADEGYVFYPHFSERIVPGWFDKKLTWRQPRPESTDRMILIAPTADFIAGLPGGKIPDRSDFKTLDDDQRLRNWHKVLAETDRLADAFNDLIVKDRWAEVAQPF